MAEKFMERERKALEKLMRREMPAKSHFQDPIYALVKDRVLCKIIGVKTLIYTVKKNRNNSKKAISHYTSILQQAPLYSNKKAKVVDSRFFLGC